MTRKIMFASFVFVLTLGLAMSGLKGIENPAVKANTVAAAAPAPAFGVCDFSYVKNVKVRDLGRSDFEVTWEFGSPDTCLQAQAFNVEVRAKRNVGGNLLGKEVLNVGGGERRAIAKFRSIAGIDKVEATVTATITLKPFGQSFLNL
ncbi:MAG: hypothetical protein HY231_20900 [Acidobacteria bacterium]|nr:hypothetical protein [Acidobacteriota bacterium]